MTTDQRTQLIALTNAILEAVKVTGSHGAPAGHLYNALMHRGISLTLFQAIMSGLVEAGEVTHFNHCYFAKKAKLPRSIGRGAIR